MEWSTIIKETLFFGYFLYKKYNKFKDIGIFLPAKLLRETHSVEKPKTKIGKELNKLFYRKWEEEYCFFENREEDLYNALKEEEIISVIGDSGIGKTRTTIEVIRKLAGKDADPKRTDSRFQDAVLVILYYKSEKYEEIKTYKKWFIKKWPLIILLYDDIDKLIPKLGKEEKDINHINNKFEKVAKKIQIICTSHQEKWLQEGKTEKEGEEFSAKKIDMKNLFNTRVEIPKLTKKQYKDVCDAVKREYREKDFTGKPGDIIYNTPKKKVQYDGLEPEHKKLLHVIKLFILGGINTPKVELVRKVAKDMFNIEKWDVIFRELKRKELFSEEEDSIEIDERYINEVIHDYRPDESTENLEEELTKLIEILIEQKAVEELGDVGEMFISRGEYKDALKCYESAIEFEKKNPYYYSKRGYIYHKLEDLEKAKKDYDQVIELETKNASVYSNRGSIFSEWGKDFSKKGNTGNALEQYDEAMKDYNKAIELDKNCAPAYFNRGNVYSNMNQYKKALADYNKAIRIDEKDVEAYNNRGNVYSNMNQYEKALADYSKAIRIDENNSYTYNNRGRVYRRLNQYEKALADYSKAIRIDENYALAYNNRGVVYYHIGNYNLALEDFTHAIDIDAKFALAYANRCEVYFSLGEKELAVDDIKVAKELNPNILIQNLREDFLREELISIELASLILTHIEDLYDSFSEEEKKVIDDVKKRLSA